MTLRELIGDVSSLGFGERLTADNIFITALNRSLRQIYGERKITDEYSFLAVGEQPLLRVPVLKHSCGERETLPLVGRVYSFYVSGTGSFTISGKGGHVRTENFSSQRMRYFGRMPEGATVTFFGELSFTVYSLVTYSNYRGDGSEDIPDGNTIKRRKMQSEVVNFLSFSGPATDADGKILDEVKLDGGFIYYPEDYTGQIRVRYTCSPRPVTEEDMDKEIDVPVSHSAYLALLVASYIYLDTDVTLAEHYGRLYRECTDRERAHESVSVGSYRYDTNGWA